MDKNNSFEYNGHTVQVYVTPLGKKWHWEWDTDTGKKGSLTGDSGASSKESAFNEAKAQAQERLK